MIVMDRPVRPETFPRRPSNITRPDRTPEPRPETRTGPRTGPGLAPDAGAPLASLARQGWTVWFGRHTRQYWAAHTGRMRLVCADSPEDLVRAAGEARP
ncbi:hypothetical protein [Nocardiopsis aegyptia]|uniref:Uncharacterized protein n=1 Tax=Nocardiopsis aegyptia TaxID=220378 RepID=A0A7Z0EM52_9ACTN|nr:hypothetical protein [Nocardiopsis aegyptia]NYJ33790.1 hypothetical protein [Nocardiopsis aegyptia]